MLLKNGDELLLRKAEKKDALGIVDYCNIVGGESDNLTFGLNEFNVTIEQEVNFIEEMNASKTSLLLVGLIENRIVCVGSVSAESRERLSHQCSIGMSVLKNYWGLGIGTCLLKEIIHFAKQTGKIEIVHLGTRTDNIRSIELYRKFGFQEIGVYRKFFKICDKYYDELLMNLYL